MKSDEERLREDLFKRIRDRHYTWAGDSADLYGMAKLPGTAAAEDILTVVAVFLANAVVALNINEDFFHQTLRKLIERRRKQEREDEL